MRVLFVTWAWPSHLYAMVPLAWALRAGGHEVRVAAPPALGPQIVAAGLPPVAAGRDVDTVPFFQTLAGRGAGFTGPATAPPAGPAAPQAGTAAPAALGPQSTSVPGRRLPRALHLFADLAGAMAGELLAYARTWRPDMVVYDPTAWAGPLAAAICGALPVRHAYGLDLLTRGREAVAALVAPICERYGLPPVDPAAAVTVDPCPTRLQLPALRDRLPMRYLPYNGARAGAVPAGAPGRRRVCVTWGTTMARLGPQYPLIPAVVAALAGTGAEVVVAVTADQRPMLGTLPPEVSVATDAPLHLVLSTCDAVVAHGGAGTMLTALAAGLPLLAIPQLPDHAAHATRLAECGAGLVIGRGEELTGERIRESVTRLLDDDLLRAAAVEISAEIAAAATPAGTAAGLVGMARQGPPVAAQRA